MLTSMNMGNFNTVYFYNGSNLPSSKIPTCTCSISHNSISHISHNSEQKCAYICSEWSVVDYGIGACWNWRTRPVGNNCITLQWRHDDCDGVSSHQPYYCLFSRLLKVHIKENIKAPRHWPLWGEFTGDKGPVAWKIFPFNDVIMSMILVIWWIPLANWTDITITKKLSKSYIYTFLV